MQRKQFFDQIQNDNLFFQKEPVIVFSCPDGATPIVFTAQLISYFKDKQMPIELFGVDDLELSHILSRLETSFLGMNISYWIRGIDELDKKSRQQLIAYIAQYKGPHQILLMVSKDEVSTGLAKRFCVELPATISADLARSLLIAFKKNSAAILKHMSALVIKHENLNLDQFCMLGSYMQVVGKADDYNQIVDRVVESEHSLFTLSQYFFAKNGTDFYKLWNSVQEIYPITFWCVYWSEQLWRAHHAHYFLTKGQLAQAKIASARLPFSYMQKDWKKTSLSELKNAHQWIYDLDRAYKNNIETESGIDLFYNKFFLNEFSK
ncbi:hypothetical protein BH09DEP1_BH09DEP1_6170 [soil metagenome]